MDDVDRTTDRQEALDQMAMRAVHAEAAAMPTGHEGYCDKCGNNSLRLMGPDYFKKKGRAMLAEDIVEGICPPCRDKLRLP